MTDPAPSPRRSFVQRRLDALEPGDRANAVLHDRSLAPRIGFKGRNALDWLASQGVSVPAENNLAARLDGGGLVCRLAPGEALILAEQDIVDRLEAARERENPAGCHTLPRADSHAWFRLEGPESPGVLAKLCGVDFRPRHFAELRIAQTMVARLATIVVRDDTNGRLAYSLLADSASALYFWDCIVEAIGENR